jgi:hypothetical protein
MACCPYVQVYLLQFILRQKDWPLIRICQEGIAIYSMHLSASHSMQLPAKRCGGKPLNYYDLTARRLTGSELRQANAAADPGGAIGAG